MRKRKWLRVILVLAALLLAASAGVSRALRTAAARRYLIAHLAASFGRPVDVGRFDFSLLDGARLEAHSVTVAEDPQFGNEYFVRADTLTAGLRWRALLVGRFEFGSFSLLRPSLNLARDAGGRWNLERWLPPTPSVAPGPGFVGPRAAPGGIQAARLYRIQVDGGRINFKQVDDKSPFALLDVSGQVEQDSTGRWQLDLEARPMRAGVELQDIGTLRLRGTIAGTSARLQPANLNLTWRAASLADALRLARQVDYGMRGELSMDLDAKIGPPEPASLRSLQSSAAEWSISGVARLTGIHSWRLPTRDSDPATNLSVDAAWQLGQPRAEIRKVVVEMAGSHLQGTGDLNWGQGFDPRLQIVSSNVGLNDILSWYRALYPDVAEDLSAKGVLGLDVTLGGWPIEIQQGAIASSGGTLAVSSLPAPLRIGAINASISHGGINLAPTEFSLSPVSPAPRKDGANIVDPRATFVLRGSIFPESNRAFRSPFNWNLAIEGEAPRAQDWVVLSQALAQPLNAGWTAAGDFAVNIRGSRQTESPGPAWLGTMDFHEFTVNSEHVNQPIRFPKAHVEFTAAQRTITLSAAQALGAAWRGTISRKNSDKRWTFDLSADRLDTAELDRWLGPRARTGFLGRFANLGNADVAPRDDGESVVARMAAHGRLRVGEIVIAPMSLEEFDGDAELAGRTIRIRNAQADFFGGKVEGSLDALLFADPSYEFHGRFDRVDLTRLGQRVPFLNNMDGTASASLALATHGIGRENLIRSLEGNGTLNARNAELPGFDFNSVFPETDQDPPLGPFAAVQGDFRIDSAGIDLVKFNLDHPRGRLQVDGRIDFSHTLNLRIRPSILQAATALTSVSPPSFLLTGTLENPKLVVPASMPSSRAGVRGR